MYYIDLAVTGISFGCMYAMMSVGLTLVYGLLRILHVAHAAVFALGAYVTVLVANATGSIALGFLAAIIVTPLFGMAIYRLLYEPLLKYRPDVPMIASVGLLVLMQDAFRIVFGEQGITFRRNAFAFTTFNFAGVTVSAVQIAIVVTAAVVFAGLHLFTTRTRIGIGWRATVSRPQIAASFGDRSDQGPLSQFRDRLGARRGRRRVGRAAEQPGRSRDRLRRQLQGARHHRPRRARQRARHLDREPGARVWSRPMARSSSVRGSIAMR